MARVGAEKPGRDRFIQTETIRLADIARDGGFGSDWAKGSQTIVRLQPNNPNESRWSILFCST